MDFFVNEHSLHGQYNDADALRAALKTLLNFRARIERARLRLFCHGELGDRPALPTINLRQAVSADRDLRGAVLSWISKSGPFWQTEQHHSPQELFACTACEDDELVTSSTLAEVAQRCLEGPNACALLSFAPSNRFNATPTRVTWHRATPSEPLDIDVANHWIADTLEMLLRTCEPEPEDWPGLLAVAQQRCLHLNFTQDVIAPLDGHPYEQAVGRRILHLLTILDHLEGSRLANGSLDARGRALHADYFEGHRPAFTDESDSNKRDFSRQLTFRHPPTGGSIFCPWHGKVYMNRHFRIHFTWPNPNPSSPLWVVYIGPKITKH